MDDSSINSSNVSVKYYSQRAISIATYLGGPLAAGFLIRQNFINSGKLDQAKHTIFISIIGTILLFASLLSIPESILEKIPNPLIPAVYTMIIYLIVETYQGQTLKKHKAENGEFYSAWKAAGVGGIGLAVILAGFFGYYSLFDSDGQYQEMMVEFQKNETEALELYTMLENNDANAIASFIKTKGIPNWKKNISLIEESNGIQDLSSDLAKQNELLKKYCLLRIESYELIEKAYIENTFVYNLRIKDLNTEIESIINQL